MEIWGVVPIEVQTPSFTVKPQSSRRNAAKAAETSATTTARNGNQADNT